MKNIIIIGGAFFVFPLVAWAQTTGFSGGVTPDVRGALVQGNAGLVLSPFKYIAPGGAEKAASDNAPKRSAALQRIVDMNAAGDYKSAGTEGLALMSSERVDDELQLIVANSLAWTGRVKEAVPVYQAISKGTFANEANVGLANINRWRGREDLALPLYQGVLDRDPANQDALEGLALASRELSPRTTVSAGVSGDSSELKRRFGAVNHRWRDKSGANLFEVEGNGFYDWTPTDGEPQRELTLRYQSLDLPLKPSLELNMPTRLNPSLYGVARIKLLDDQVTLSAGRLNWGKAVANPVAARQGLVANHLGVEASESFSMGSLVGRVNYYGISDTNTVFTAGLNFNSAWRPLGSHFKPFAGLESRSAKFNAPTYWSPVDGSGTVFAGLLGEWGDSDWNFFASAQLGAPLYGDAGNSWSVSAGGKRWLTNDIALGLNLWSMTSWRDSSAYRSKSLNVNLEKLWR
jgi:hypothetical protein